MNKKERKNELLAALNDLLNDIHLSDSRITDHLNDMVEWCDDFDDDEAAYALHRNEYIATQIMKLVDEHDLIAAATLNQIGALIDTANGQNEKKFLRRYYQKKAEIMESLQGETFESLQGETFCQNIESLQGETFGKSQSFTPQLEDDSPSPIGENKGYLNIGGDTTALPNPPLLPNGNNANESDVTNTAVPPTEVGRPPQSPIGDPAGQSKDFSNREGQHNLTAGNTLGDELKPKRRWVMKAPTLKHLRFNRDCRRIALSKVDLQLYHNVNGNGTLMDQKALWSGAIEYTIRMKDGEEHRNRFADFITQKNFRENMNRPIKKPSYKDRNVPHGDLKQFRHDPWWLEVNEWLKYQNQIREEAGLPEVLVSCSQQRERNKKGFVVWVHKDDHRVLFLYRDGKGNPTKVQMIDRGFTIDFVVFNPVISDKPNAAKLRSTWFKE